MTKIFLFGSNSIKNEFKALLKDKAEFTNTLDNKVEIVIDSTNYPSSKKRDNIETIDKHCTAAIPVLSSSLCIPVSEQCTYSKFPSRLIGIGLYDTFSAAGRIEIAPSKITEDAVLKNAESILTGLGFAHSVVPDRTGLVFPRIVSMIINEAVQVYAEKIATKEDIDTAMKLGTNYPYGPLEWADRLGIELVFNILSALQRDFGEDRYRPHPVLKEMVNLKQKFYS
jgi:3-hydroxybutyryl-CoA dehydrogenase